MRVVDVDHFLGTLKSIVEKNGSEEWRKIANTMAYMINTEATLCGRDIVECGDCKYYDSRPGWQSCQAFGKWFGEEEMGANDYCSRGERQ